MAYTTQIGHRPVSGTRPRGRSRGLTKLLVCAILFFAAVVAKITGIPAVSETIVTWIDAGSVEESLAVLGISVTDRDYGVTEVFSSWVQEVFAPDADLSETTQTAVSDLPEETPPVVSVIDQTEEFLPVVPVDLPAQSDPAPAVVVLPTGHISIGDATEHTMPVSETELDAEAGLPLPDVVSTEAVSIDFGFVTPVVGYITSDFGYRDHPLDGEYKFHYGVDIGASEGTEILAFADGVVNTVLVGEINGNYFKVQHDDGIVSMYAHCQKIVVKPGQKVKKGDVIAYVGQTGQVSGPHLHFQLYQNGKIIDPTEFLEVAA